MLTQIRQTFTPMVPIRWRVIFSEPRLNIAAGMFPAKDVNYDRFRIENASATIAPGFELQCAALRLPPTRLDITFYENDSYAIQNFFIETLAQLANGSGGWVGLDVTIEELDVTLGSIVSSELYTVQLTDDMKRILVQDASAYESPIAFNIIGSGQEP